MKYMLNWKIPPENHQSVARKFLESGAPMPEGVTLIGRWHAPGSVSGWALIETDNPAAIHEHVTRWASMLVSTCTPVVEDAQAAESIKMIYG